MTSPVVEWFGADDLPLVSVTTERLRLVFAPTRGGRLLGLAVDGTEVLWTNPRLVDEAFRPVLPVAEWPAADGGMSTWANVGGSKTWPAPQGWSGPGEWAGPPDVVLDSGPWAIDVAEGVAETVAVAVAVNEDVDEYVHAHGEAEPGAASGAERGRESGGDTVVTLRSARDPRSGLQVTRRFTVPPTGLEFTQQIVFANISAEPVRWSIWEVCQVDTAGGAGLPVDEASIDVPVEGSSPEFPAELDLGTYWGALESTGSAGPAGSTREIRLPVGTAVAKRGYPRALGPVSYRNAGHPGLTLSTAPQASAPYPDGGSRVEVWLQAPTPGPIDELEGLHPDAHLVELEVLGPLVTLAPEQSTSLDIAWSVQPPTR